MEKETKYSMFDEATISKMLDMFTEIKERVEGIMKLQYELAWMLCAGGQDLKSAKTIIPSTPGIEDSHRGSCGHTYEIEKKSEAKLTQSESYAIGTYMKYGFCNSADTTLCHIRRITDGGRTPINTRSLCDTQVTCVYTPTSVSEMNIDYNVCLQCAVMYRREQGEQYHANRETDQHKQEGKAGAQEEEAVHSKGTDSPPMESTPRGGA